MENAQVGRPRAPGQRLHQGALFPGTGSTGSRDFLTGASPVWTGHLMSCVGQGVCKIHTIILVVTAGALMGGGREEGAQSTLIWSMYRKKLFISLSLSFPNI